MTIPYTTNKSSRTRTAFQSDLLPPYAKRACVRFNADQLITKLFFSRLEEFAKALDVSFKYLSPRSQYKVYLAWQALPFICRFDKESTESVGNTYQHKTKYLESQIDYGLTWRGVVRQAIGKDRGFWDLFNCWSEHSMEVALNRGSRAAPLFSFLRTEVMEEDSLVTPLSGRYAFVLDHIRDTAVNRVKMIGERSYIVGYPSPENPNSYIELTTVVMEDPDNCFLSHTHRSCVIRLIPQVKKLYTEFKRLREGSELTGRNQSESKHLLHLAIEIYWLAVQLSRTFRGNAQYCQNFLYLAFEELGLYPLIPKKGILLDCIALTTPLHIFKKCFLQYLEPPSTVSDLHDTFSSLFHSPTHKETLNIKESFREFCHDFDKKSLANIVNTGVRHGDIFATEYLEACKKLVLLQACGKIPELNLRMVCSMVDQIHTGIGQNPSAEQRMLGEEILYILDQYFEMNIENKLLTPEHRRALLDHTLLYTQSRQLTVNPMQLLRIYFKLIVLHFMSIEEGEKEQIYRTKQIEEKLIKYIQSPGAKQREFATTVLEKNRALTASYLLSQKLTKSAS